MNVADPGLKRFLDIIDSSIKKFRLLISDIAAVAKMENNALVTELVDLDETLDNIEWSLSDLIQTSGAVINRDLGEKHIQFSKKNLRSILFNLVSNAVKYRSEKAPVIAIHTSRKEGNIVLSVRDTGAGMEHSQVGKIFDKYTRLQINVEGQGIGLYLTKKIIDAQGGRIVVESEPGKGSTFTLNFHVEAGNERL
jgi:two-component system CheB/CheR fusion protein